MTIRTALIATVKLLKEVAAARAERREPQPGRSPPDRFEFAPKAGGGAAGGLANKDSGGGDPRSGTQVEWGR